MFNKLVSWIAVFWWMSLIFWLSSKPTVVPMINPLISFVISTLGHLVVYAILYLLTYRALHVSSFTRRQIVLTSLLIVLLYGISDEFHQSFVPGREASVLDVIFDLLGGVIVARL